MINACVINKDLLFTERNKKKTDDYFVVEFFSRSYISFYFFQFSYSLLKQTFYRGRFIIIGFIIS